MDNRYAEELADHKRAEDRFHDLLRQAAQLVAERDWWRIGDGEGGWVLEAWTSSLAEHGLQKTKSRTYRRKTTDTSLQLSVYRRDDFTCQSCGEVGGDLTVDHIWPVSKGGGDDMSNLQALCRPCNSSKRDRVDA